MANLTILVLIVVMDIIITLVILLFSAIIHEISHGLMAERLGDDTAREQGRITLNPIVHIDPFGSVMLPLLLLAVGSPIVFGAAKPVPVNFSNLRDPKKGMALVSLAGPLANLALAVVFVLPLKLGLANSISEPILARAIVLNIVLATFNLMPIPPLDGSKILASLGSDRFMYQILSLERWGFVLVLVFLWLGVLDKILVPAVLLFSRIFNVSLF